MRYFLFFCTLLMLLPNSAFADVRLAVLDFRGVGVSSSLLEQLADDVHSGLLSASKGQKRMRLIMYTREKLEQRKVQGLSEGVPCEV